MISRREAILETIRLSLLSIDPTIHDPEAYPYKFSGVVRQPLSEEATLTKRLLGAVFPGEEAKAYQLSFTSASLQVTVEFSFTMNAGDAPPATEVENLIAMVQKAILSDTTLNGLALDTAVVGVSVDLDATPEKVIEGAVFFTVDYRHDLADPRTYMGAFPDAPQPVVLT